MAADVTWIFYIIIVTTFNSVTLCGIFLMTSAGVTSLTTCRAFFLGSKSSCFQPVTFSMFSLFRAEAVQWNLLHQSGQHSTTTSIQKTVRRLTALQYNTIQHEQFKDNVSNRFIIRLLSSLINWWCVSVIMLLHNIKDNTIFFSSHFHSVFVCYQLFFLPAYTRMSLSLPEPHSTIAKAETFISFVLV